MKSRKLTKEEENKITRMLFEIYFHFDKIETLLNSFDIVRLPIKTELILMLESHKLRAKKIRSLFDDLIGEKSAEYGEMFDQLNELLEKHMKITVTD